MKSLPAAFVLLAVLAVPAVAQPGQYLDSLLLSTGTFNQPAFAAGKIAGRPCLFFEQDSVLSYLYLDEFGQKKIHPIRKLGGTLKSVHSEGPWLAYTATDSNLAVLDLRADFHPVFDTTFANVRPYQVQIDGDRVGVAQTDHGTGLIDLSGKPAYRSYPLPHEEVRKVFIKGDLLLFLTEGNLWITRPRGDTLDTLARHATTGLPGDMETAHDTLLLTTYDFHSNQGLIWYFDLGRPSLPSPLHATEIAGQIHGHAFARDRYLFAQSDGLHYSAKSLAGKVGDTASFPSVQALTPRYLFSGDFLLHGDSVLVLESRPDSKGYTHYLSLFRLTGPILIRKAASRKQASITNPSQWTIDGRRVGPVARPGKLYLRSWGGPP